MSKSGQAAVAEPVISPQRGKKVEKRREPRRQPRYQVILWDDNDHTYDYVIRMMRKLFGHTLERAYELACEVDCFGRAICLTTTREHAELKRDQIHSFGKDSMIARCEGSMYSTIEPIE